MTVASKSFKVHVHRWYVSAIEMTVASKSFKVHVHRCYVSVQYR